MTGQFGLPALVLNIVRRTGSLIFNRLLFLLTLS